MAGGKMRVVWELNRDAWLVIALVRAWRLVGDVMRSATGVNNGSCGCIRCSRCDCDCSGGDVLGGWNGAGVIVIGRGGGRV